jgi:hypothetical protein
MAAVGRALVRHGVRHWRRLDSTMPPAPCHRCFSERGAAVDAAAAAARPLPSAAPSTPSEPPGADVREPQQQQQQAVETHGDPLQRQRLQPGVEPLPMQYTASGVPYYDVIVGTGRGPYEGCRLGLHFTVMAVDSDKIIETTHRPNTPAHCYLGDG